MHLYSEGSCQGTCWDREILHMLKHHERPLETYVDIFVSLYLILTASEGNSKVGHNVPPRVQCELPYTVCKIGLTSLAQAMIGSGLGYGNKFEAQCKVKWNVKMKMSNLICIETFWFFNKLYCWIRLVFVEIGDQSWLIKRLGLMSSLVKNCYELTCNIYGMWWVGGGEGWLGCQFLLILR